jgi:hypothetical protein
VDLSGRKENGGIDLMLSGCKRVHEVLVNIAAVWRHDYVWSWFKRAQQQAIDLIA